MSIALAEEVVSEVTGQVTEVAEQAAEGRLTLDIGNNLLYAILGYLVVFIGLSLLMIVIVIVGKIMVAKLKAAKAPAEAPAPVAAAPAVKALPAAPGTAGEVKIYDTDPKDAAMIMAIVADKLQKPLNELRFVSIKEVK
jgi:Na+-transporting methylmalonyl-CoA/oxaloacetate decarboxylase gamma subunit